jgi:hypothetical protein
MISLAAVFSQSEHRPGRHSRRQPYALQSIGPSVAAHSILDEGAVGFFGISPRGAIITMTAKLPVGFFSVVVRAVA